LNTDHSSSKSRAARITQLTSYEACAALRGEWDEIVARYSNDMLQPDVTATYEWARDLAFAWQQRLVGLQHQILVLEKDGHTGGILPLYRSAREMHRVAYRQIAPITQVYAGRVGFLLRDQTLEDLTVLLDYLFEEVSDWDVFEVTLVEGSVSERLFREYCRLRGRNFEMIGTRMTPYTVLDCTWDEYMKSLPKTLRQGMKKGHKKLMETGPAEHCWYTECRDLESFYAAILDIERNSWKELSGTSLTQNHYQEDLYRSFMRSAAERGWFSGHLLFYRGEPIAYNYGLLHNGIFYAPKTSYKTRYREFSPGHVLDMLITEYLFEKKVRYYDQMGGCEAYKMRMSDHTYSRTTYLLFNSSLRGRLAALGSAAANQLKRFRKPQDPAGEASPVASCSPFE
jgi:CelD/BcsL family acetyltransferase involved in cellulose biosynthesis